METAASKEERELLGGCGNKTRFGERERERERSLPLVDTLAYAFTYTHIQ